MTKGKLFQAVVKRMKKVGNAKDLIEVIRSQVLELSQKSEKNFKETLEYSNTIKQLGVDLSRNDAQEWNDFMTVAIGDE